MALGALEPDPDDTDDAPDAYDRARENDLEDMQGIWENDR